MVGIHWHELIKMSRMCCAQNWNKIENKWMAIPRPGRGAAYAYPGEKKNKSRTVKFISLYEDLQLNLSDCMRTYSKIYLTAWGLSIPDEMIINSKCRWFGIDDWDNFSAIWCPLIQSKMEAYLRPRLRSYISYKHWTISFAQV